MEIVGLVFAKAAKGTRSSISMQAAKKEQLRSSSKAAWTADQRFDSGMAASDSNTY